MRVLAIIYQRDAPAGVFEEAIVAAGVELDRWHAAEAGSPPAPIEAYDAVIGFGGAMHADQVDRHPWLAGQKRLLSGLLDRDLPLLGVCLGAQLLSEAAGGEPRRAAEPEIGWAEVEVTEAGAADPLLGPLAPRFEAFEWHSYECGVPTDATVLAQTPVCAQAFRVGDRAWGVQFHAEVSAAIVGSWIDEYHVDPDAVRIGLDPERLRAATATRIEAWNELGRGLCSRFLETAA